MEDRIRQVVTETLDRVATKGSCDFVEDIAVPIPMVFIAELMGLPVEDRDQFWRWSDAMMAGEGRSEGDPELDAAGQAFGEYMAYVSGLVADRRESYRSAKAEGRDPKGDDLISVLVAAAEEVLGRSLLPATWSAPWWVLGAVTASVSAITMWRRDRGAQLIAPIQRIRLRPDARVHEVAA